MADVKSLVLVLACPYAHCLADDPQPLCVPFGIKHVLAGVLQKLKPTPGSAMKYCLNVCYSCPSVVRWR